MKKSKKIICGIAGACILLGAVLLGAGFAMGGSLQNSFRIRGDVFHFDSWQMDTDTNAYEGRENIDAQDFHTLHVDIDYGDIEIKQGNEYKVLIENVPKDEYSVKQDNGVLTIEYRNSTIFNFGFQGFDKDYKYTIVVPQALEQIKIDSKMGDIDVENIIAKELFIDQAMGDVDIENTKISETLHVNQKMGDIDFRGVCEGNAEFSNAMGDTDIIVLANEAEYSYDLSTSLGSLKVNGRKRGDGMNASFESDKGKHKIIADNSMGDISLEFH